MFPYFSVEACLRFQGRAFDFSLLFLLYLLPDRQYVKVGREGGSLLMGVDQTGPEN